MTNKQQPAATQQAAADAREAQLPLAVSADTVALDMDRLVEDGVIAPADKGLVLWLVQDAKAKGLSQTDVGKNISYDAATVSRLLHGRYTGNHENVMRAIRRYKHLVDERGKMVRADFVETSIWTRIRDTCDLALVHQMPALIVGVSQIGKTESLREYARRSEYVVRYVRMPAAPGFRGVLEAVADACNVTTRCTSEQLRRRVGKSLDTHTLLIVDELHQLAISAGQNSAMKVMEWIRELTDTSGCGLVCCGTEAVDQDLIGGTLKAWLDQFAQRLIKRLVLPKRLPDDDIRLVGKAFGLPAPSDRVMDILRPLRMNRLVKTLMLAGNLARKRGVPLDWSVFETTFNTLNK